MAKPQSIQQTLPRVSTANSYGKCCDPGVFDRAGGYWYWGGNKKTKKNPHKCSPGPNGELVACQSYFPCPNNGGGLDCVCTNSPINCEGELDLGEWSRITRRDVRA